MKSFFIVLLIFSLNGIMKGIDFYSFDQKIKLCVALDSMSIKHGVYFTYDRTMLSSYEVDYKSIEDLSFKEQLHALLEGTNLSFKIFDEQFVIIYRNDEAGIESMKKMLQHMEQIVSSSESTKSKKLGASSIPELKNLSGISKSQRESMSNHIQVTGVIRDSDKNPLIGVNVLVKGTAIGAATNYDGRYQLNNVDKNGTLIISYVGYELREIPIEGRSTIDVELLENSETLDEVIVVGYNSIDKKHLASSIEVLDMEKVNSRPIEKLEEVFAGTIAGVTMMQGNNLPGSVPGAIRIRGLSTLQDGNPLVIIDGMEQSLTDIDPNQVKSISVLKDAAAASMYGSRGANGVIIVETHRGESGKFKVGVHTWMATQRPTDLPTFVNAADYMRLNNEAREIQGQTLLYDQIDIQNAENGVTPQINWMDEIMMKNPYSSNLSANISGGGGVGSFNLMMGYFDSQGLNDFEGSRKFNARFNTNINLADKFILLADFYANKLYVDRLQMDANGNSLYERAWEMNPTQLIFYPNSDLENHYILHNNSRNPMARIWHGGIHNNVHDESSINLRPSYYINRKLHISGNISYLIKKSASKFKRETFKFFDGDNKPSNIWKNSVGSSQGVSRSQITARALLNYESTLRNSKDKTYFILGAEIIDNNYTDYREVSKASFFTKLNYSVDDRFLLEGTFRADGSSKFAPKHRWGYFPSLSAGWNVHNEPFMNSITNSKTINRLKLRASYGYIGNENVDPYLWQEIVNIWGWTIRVPNPTFTWEKQKQYNLGVDLSILDNRLNMTFDTYLKHSYDLIYSSFPVPPLTGSHGLTSSVNIGEVENRGWEISMDWNDQWGDLKYSVRGMLFDNKNRVLKAGYSDRDTLIFKDNDDRIWYKGVAVFNHYGFETDGYFQTQAEIDETLAKFPNTLPGDIKYVDQNNDNIINNKDRVNLGDPFPHLNYSIGVDLQFKKWDFSVLGQGVGKRNGRLNGQEGFPVRVDGSSNDLGAPRQYYADNRWTPETPNSRFPRVWTGSSTNTFLSDVWLSNAAFFRLKSIQLGYSISSLGKSFKNIRIYVNAQDAITFTKWEGLNPERNGGNGNYPRMASYGGGIKATIF